jgi:hypothetical protein
MKLYKQINNDHVSRNHCIIITSLEENAVIYISTTKNEH